MGNGFILGLGIIHSGPVSSQTCQPVSRMLIVPGTGLKFALDNEIWRFMWHHLSHTIVYYHISFLLQTISAEFRIS